MHLCDPKTGRKLLLSQKYTLVGIKTSKIGVCQIEEFHGLVFRALITECCKIGSCLKHQISNNYQSHSHSHIF